MEKEIKPVLDLDFLQKKQISGFEKSVNDAALIDI